MAADKPLPRMSGKSFVFSQNYIGTDTNAQRAKEFEMKEEEMCLHKSDPDRCPFCMRDLRKERDRYKRALEDAHEQLRFGIGTPMCILKALGIIADPNA